MKFMLATAVSCSKTSCVIMPLGSKTQIAAQYSTLVQDRIMIRPEHLVVINTNPNPPEIMWRWLRGVLIELSTNTITVDDMQGHPAEVKLVPELPLQLSLDDEVWMCGTGDAFEIHDLIIDGKPAHPERLLEYITPIIEKIYSVR